MADDEESGLGTGELSPAARERLARPPVAPLRPPPLDDLDGVARWRTAVHAAWLDGDPPVEQCGHRAEMVGGVPCLRAGQGSGVLVVYFHGGGYALGSPEVAVPITERLAVGSEVVSVGYRLAPEHPWPAAVDDGVAVHRTLATGHPGRPIVLVGDSAGANIALSVALAGEGPVAALVLLSPHLDLAGPERAFDQPLSDVDAGAAGWLRQAYCGAVPADDLRVSPLRADLSGLPLTLVQVGSRDTSLDNAVRFARRARRAGVDVELDVWPDLWHTWHYHRDLPEADLALAEARRFIASHT